MLKGQSPLGLTYYFPVFANTHPDAELLEMIATGEAKPFPPQLSHVMDNMFWWGKTHSYEWYEEVVDSMGELLDNNSEDEEVDQREVVRHLIGFAVKSKILEHFDMMSAAFEVTFDQSHTNFNLVYPKQLFDAGGPRTAFRQMAESSFEYLEWLILAVKSDMEFMEEHYGEDKEAS